MLGFILAVSILDTVHCLQNIQQVLTKLSIQLLVFYCSICNILFRYCHNRTYSTGDGVTGSPVGNVRFKVSLPQKIQFTLMSSFTPSFSVLGRVGNCKICCWYFFWIFDIQNLMKCSLCSIDSRYRLLKFLRCKVSVAKDCYTSHCHQFPTGLLRSWHFLELSTVKMINERYPWVWSLTSLFYPLLHRKKGLLAGSLGVNQDKTIFHKDQYFPPSICVYKVVSVW